MDTPTNENEIRSIIESVLFAAGHPISYEKLAKLFDTQPSKIKKLVQAYAQEYNSTDFPRGVLMLAYDDSCQLCTKEEYAPYIREALNIRRGGNLSNSSIETLAIIAYNQPTTRAYVDLVRGVDSTYAVNALCDRELIETCGRLDAPGRPMLYKTTENFLRCFGLNSLSELPPMGQEALDMLSALKGSENNEDEQEEEPKERELSENVENEASEEPQESEIITSED